MIDSTIKNDYQELEQMLLNLLIDPQRCGRLKTCNKIFALYSFFEEKNLEKTKQHFYNCALLDSFRINTYNDRMFDYDLHSIGYAMLSDNIDFIKTIFAKLTYQSTYLEDVTEKVIHITMEENVLAGEGAIFTHTVQQFLLGNNSLIERNLEIMEKVWFNTPNENNTLHYDVNFFKALYQKNFSKCEEVIKEMLSPKNHKKRNDDALLNKYISMPALGYVKLAWILGYELKIKNKLIPNELLPIQPLEKYEIPYDFLR